MPEPGADREPGCSKGEGRFLVVVDRAVDLPQSKPDPSVVGDVGRSRAVSCGRTLVSLVVVKGIAKTEAGQGEPLVDAQTLNPGVQQPAISLLFAQGAAKSDPGLIDFQGNGQGLVVGSPCSLAIVLFTQDVAQMKPGFAVGRVDVHGLPEGSRRAGAVFQRRQRRPRLPQVEASRGVIARALA